MEPNTPREITNVIERLGISTWGDIVTTENKIADTLAKDMVIGPFLRNNYVVNKEQMDEGVTLRVGQCWIKREGEEQEIILEYLGRSEKKLCLRKWIWYEGRGNNQNIQETDKVVIAEGSHSMGAGTKIWMTYDEIFDKKCMRVIVTEDKILTTLRTENCKKIYREVVAIWETQPPMIHKTDEDNKYKEKWEITTLSETMYTDASIKTVEGNVMDILSGQEAKVYTSAVMITTKDTREQEGKISALRLMSEQTTLGATSYNMELLAIGVGGHINEQRKDIQTDSQSSEKHLKGIKKKQRGAPNYINALAEECYKKNDITFIKSHVEDRKHRNEYSTHEWGNMYADTVSKLRKHENPTELERHELESKAIDIEEVLTDIMETGQWYWGDKNGTVGFLGGPMIQIHNSRRKKYLENREENQTAEVRYAWTTVNLTWTSKVWRMSKRGLAEAARLQRMILDWHYDGRNKMKNKKASEEDGRCTCCGQPDSQIHWMMQCTNKELTRARGAIFIHAQGYLEKKKPIMRSIGQQIIAIYKQQPYGYKAMIGMWDETATMELGKVTKEAEKEGVTDNEMRTFLLAFQRSTTQDITTMLNIRLKLQENNDHTRETTNWYGSQSTGTTATRSKHTQTQRREQQCLRDIKNKRKGQTFVQGRYNKQMTDYYTATTKTTTPHIEVQDEEKQEEQDSTQWNEGEEQAEENDSMADKTGNKGGRGKREKKTRLEKKQARHPVHDWPNKSQNTCIFPTVNGGMRIAAYRNERVSIRPSTTHGWGLFLDASPGIWEANNRVHLHRHRKPQYFDPGPVCRYYGPRHTLATLPENHNANDYIWEHPTLNLFIDGEAPLSSHARSMNEGFENNNSELKWWKGELWVFTLWALEEGNEVFGGYALPYWKEKGDKDTLEIAERYYKDCQDKLEKEKPLGTKDEDNWETRKKKKAMRGKQKKTKLKIDTRDTTEGKARISIDNEMNEMRELFDCNTIECDGGITQRGGGGFVDYDNHAG